MNSDITVISFLKICGNKAFEKLNQRGIQSSRTIYDKIDLPLINRSVRPNGRVAESADAQDLKSPKKYIPENK